jgi:hypothetical protein
MATHEYEAPVDLPADDLFEYLRDVRHLAELGANRVTEHGWVRVDGLHRTLVWGGGTSGTSDDLAADHGSLQVRETGPGSCTVHLELHTRRGTGAEIRQTLDRAVAVLTQGTLADADPEDSGQSWP